MVNTRQFSGSTYMQDMTKSHTFSAKNQGSTYTPIRLIRREIRYFISCFRVQGQGRENIVSIYIGDIFNYSKQTEISRYKLQQMYEITSHSFRLQQIQEVRPGGGTPI